MEELNEIQERDVEKRSNGSQVFTEPYSEASIGRLKNLVLAFFRQGERKFYSIHIDGETVVPKNSDGRKFNRYLQFLNKYTHSVEVRMYQGYSPNCNKYLFIVNKGLSGHSDPEDVQDKINKALEEQRLQNELAQLRKELEKKTKKLKKLKRQAEESESGIDKLNELVRGGAKIAGTIAGAINAKNGGGLSGAEHQTAQPDAEVEVEIEEGVQPQTNPKKKKSKSERIFKDLVDTYGEEGLENAMGWMTVLSENPELQQMIKEQLKNQKNQKDGEA